MPIDAVARAHDIQPSLRMIATQRLELDPQLAEHADEMFVLLQDPALYQYENEAPRSVERGGTPHAAHERPAVVHRQGHAGARGEGSHDGGDRHPAHRGRLVRRPAEPARGARSRTLGASDRIVAPEAVGTMPYVRQLPRPAHPNRLPGRIDA